jgi:hypothetical protein
MQEIYIYMDDSGKLTNKEMYCIYSGIIFTSIKEKQDFSNKYRAIIKSIKCKYCKGHIDTCSCDCPEVKSFIIEKSDRRQIINLCKQYKIFSLIINNDHVYPYIMRSKASRGRFVDYTQKIMFKEIIIKLIKEGVIIPTEPIKFVINIDQQTTKTNGYYNLGDGIFEELKHGYENFNYGTYGKPVVYNDLSVDVHYNDSKKSIAIQAADIIAGTTRRIMYYNEPQKKKVDRLGVFNWIFRFFP